MSTETEANRALEQGIGVCDTWGQRGSAGNRSREVWQFE